MCFEVLFVVARLLLIVFGVMVLFVFCILFRSCVFCLCTSYYICVCLYMRVICCVRVSSPFLFVDVVVACLFGVVMLLAFESRFKPDAFVYG